MRVAATLLPIVALLAVAGQAAAVQSVPVGATVEVDCEDGPCDRASRADLVADGTLVETAITLPRAPEVNAHGDTSTCATAYTVGEGGHELGAVKPCRAGDAPPAARAGDPPDVTVDPVPRDVDAVVLEAEPPAPVYLQADVLTLSLALLEATSLDLPDVGGPAAATVGIRTSGSAVDVVGTTGVGRTPRDTASAATDVAAHLLTGERTDAEPGAGDPPAGWTTADDGPTLTASSVPTGFVGLRPVALVASGLAVSALALLLGRIVAALYTRLGPSDLLRHPSRNLVHEALRGSGALTAAELAEAVGLHRKTVRYHAQTLVDAGLLVKDEGGRYRVPGQPRPTGLDERIVDAVDREPGIHVAALARRLDVSKACAQAHVMDLIVAGRLARRTSGGARRLYPRA